MAPKELASETYDYIICGGGTAGCVLAGRLAETENSTILIIEAGPHQEAVPAATIPAAVSKILGTEADWNIQSEPCEHLNNRKLHLARGKFLGGSSGCNGTLSIRGVPQDYDDWNVAGWSGEEMFHYMRKAEDFRSNDWFEGAIQAHGRDGPIITSPHEPAPISERMLQSFQSKGFLLLPDMFTTGESAVGCGHAVRTVYKGVRSTPVEFLSRQKGGTSNVTIKTGIFVDKILAHNVDGKLRASAVIVEGEDMSKMTFVARREIILAAGTYGSPAILLRSGIGPAKEVAELGVEPLLDLPGVGKNLMDHLVLLNFYEVSEPGLTHDHLIWHTGGREKSMQAYKESRTGFFSQFPFGAFAFTRLDDRLKNSPLWTTTKTDDERDAMGTLPCQPHVEFWNTECYSPKYMFKDFPPDGKYAFAMATMFFHARSRGEVTLRSFDPRENPRVQHNYLQDPLDMLVFSEACQLANEIALEGMGTKDVIAGSWPVGQGHDKFTRREQWEEAIRERADTCYHPAGTCKMGRREDEMAVVDAELCVHGVEGLRVVDASIMPLLMSGHPQMPVMAIAEKAADLIKARWALAA
ncbi:alcohol oxidase [Westerdykella ornata]|uniref:Alcohol oxidase n=1 Tax=Westerdykella ornata TaxID=318751 RepID=A0A6A6JC68_WESOR|nr:alcohol oxidase [Westerdykella ornata]KAF2272789.1 alcohol oxidase [Westerdykella ornata]